MSSSPEAGPSQSYDDDEPTQTQTAHMPAPRKKARMSQAEIFDQPDSKVRAKIGQSLRDLQTAVEDDIANVKNLTIENFRKALDKQDAVFLNVQDTESGALDAKVFATRTELVYAWSRQQNQNTNSFDTDEFFIQLKSLLGRGRRMGAPIEIEEDDGSGEDDELDEDDSQPRARKSAGNAAAGRGAGSETVLGDWERIGWMAAKMNRRVQGIEFMYGPLSLEHKKRVVRERAKKAALAPEQKPTVIVQEGNAPKGEDTVVFVRRVYRDLEKVDPTNSGINFFRFAINPHSFGQSVENIFFISFLIRDGRVGLDVGADGEMIIRIMDKHEEGGGPKPGGGTNQGVMEFDMGVWELAKETFDITECLIPNRVPKEAPQIGAKTWY